MEVFGNESSTWEKEDNVKIIDWEATSMVDLRAFQDQRYRQRSMIAIQIHPRVKIDTEWTEQCEEHARVTALEIT